DTFVLDPTTGGSNLSDADIIKDFDSFDVIGLNGIRYQDLVITNGTGDDLNNAIISFGSTGNYLAVLENVDGFTLDPSRFVKFGNLPTPEPTPPAPTPPAPTPDPNPTPDPTPTTDPTPTPTPGPTPEPTPEPTPPPTPNPVPPNPQDDQLVTNKNQRLTFTGSTLLKNDIDPNGDEMTISQINQPRNGTITDISSNLSPSTFLYTPQQNYVGTDSFAYVVTDTSGSTGSAIVSIKVNAPPQLIVNRPLIVAKSPAGSPLVLTEEHLLVTDVDNTPAELEYTLVTRPVFGNLREVRLVLEAGDTFTQNGINNNLIIYGPGAASGYDSFSFTVSDGDGGTIPENTFKVTVVDE
ncbi:MAG: Ig-like domain-containing protein, partial [Microcoleaceae cyanobacterium]